jgi:hypothetical protein
LEVESTNETSSESNAIPAAITDALAGVFGSDEAEAPAKGRVDADTNLESQEEADEIEQEEAAAGHTETPESSDEDEIEEVAPEGEKPAAEQTPKLDPYLRYIAGENGWTPEKIDKLYKADPELAQQTFQSIADSYTALSRQYVQPGSPVAPGTQATTPAQTDASPTPNLDKFMADLAAFSEANGEDMGRFAKLVNDELATPLKAMIAQNVVREQELIREQSVSAFNGVRKDFGDFYGPENGNLSPGQQQARADLATLADQIRAGAKAQGRDVSIKDAISRAHAVITADIRQAAARREVASQVQKRSKQITAKPTQRRNPRTAGSRSDEAAMAAYEQAAAQIGHETADW